MRYLSVLFSLCAVIGLYGCDLSAPDVELATVTPPGISGTVIDAINGDPVAQATLVLRNLDTQTVIAQLTTNALGAYHYASTDLGNTRYQLDVTAANYAPHSAVVVSSADSLRLHQNVYTVPTLISTAFDSTQATELTYNDHATVYVELLANGLQRQDASAPVGPVSANIAVIDPAAENRLLSGNYQLSSGQFFESFGGLSVFFQDNDGQRLNATAAQPFTIRIPLASSVAVGSLPQSTALYHYNASTGYWRAAAIATLQQFGGEFAYEAQVNDLGHWSAGQLTDTVNLFGCVRYQPSSEGAQEQPAVGIVVYANGLNYIGRSYGISNQNGQFTLPVPRQSDVLLVASVLTGFEAENVAILDTDVTLTDCLVLSPSIATITLSWGANPSDLDSHLYGPTQQPDTQFHISYSNKTETVEDALIYLDVDDTTQFGPEIINFTAIPLAGHYQYLVHQFAGSSNIAASPAKVELNLYGATQVFSPADASGTLSSCWAVFALDVQSDGQVSISPIQRFVSEQVCTETGLNTSVQIDSTQAVGITSQTKPYQRFYHDRMQ